METPGQKPIQPNASSSTKKKWVESFFIYASYIDRFFTVGAVVIFTMQAFDETISPVSVFGGDISVVAVTVFGLLAIAKLVSIGIDIYKIVELKKIIEDDEKTEEANKEKQIVDPKLRERTENNRLLKWEYYLTLISDGAIFLGASLVALGNIASFESIALTSVLTCGQLINYIVPPLFVFASGLLIWKSIVSIRRGGDDFLNALQNLVLIVGIYISVAAAFTTKYVLVLGFSALASASGIGIFFAVAAACGGIMLIGAIAIDYFVARNELRVNSKNSGQEEQDTSNLGSDQQRQLSKVDSQPTALGVNSTCSNENSVETKERFQQAKEFINKIGALPPNDFDKKKEVYKNDSNIKMLLTQKPSSYEECLRLIKSSPFPEKVKTCFNIGNAPSSIEAVDWVLTKCFIKNKPGEDDTFSKLIARENKQQSISPVQKPSPPFYAAAQVTSKNESKKEDRKPQNKCNL
jgi:hypothetical protein